MTNSPEILGYVAASLTTCAFLPQAIKTIVSKHVLGLSIGMLTLQLLGNFLWIWYGYWIKSPSLFLANCATGLLVTILFLTVINYRFFKKNKES